MKKNRQLFIAGNWKMNTSVTEGVKLAEGLKEKYGNIKGVRLAVAVPFTHISDVGKVIKGTSIELAAQNMNENEKGAYETVLPCSRPLNLKPSARRTDLSRIPV